ncbi:MAG: hypothetical protein E7262_07970 [Lachnospiraceae bacterium]|nr:hypothetical protein [Lachnospiraceae bacterium]
MSLGLKIFAVGSLLYYLDTKREVVYFKKSRIARLPITLTKWAMIIGFIALAIGAEVFFIKQMMGI